MQEQITVWLTLAAEETAKAEKMAGWDNTADAYHQGRAQVYAQCAHDLGAIIAKQ